MSGTFVGMPAFPRPPPATPSATPRCAATCATPPTPSATSAPRPSPNSPTGSSCARPASASRTTRCAISTTIWSSWRSRSPPPGAPCTGQPTRTRPTGSSPTWSEPPGRRRWSRSSRWPPRRSASTRRSPPKASTPTRPTSPSSSSSSATTGPRTSWSPPSTATGARSATSSASEMGSWGRPAPDGLTDDARRPRRGGPAAPAGEVPAGEGGRLGRQLHGRRHRHPGRLRVRGQRPHVPDPARDPDLGRRHREGRSPPGRTWRSSSRPCRAPRRPSG